MANLYKSLVRGIAKEMGIPVPEAFFIKPEDNIFELPFDFPVIVKPNHEGSSKGIGEEAVAGGAMPALGPDDNIVATYRELSVAKLQKLAQQLARRLAGGPAKQRGQLVVVLDRVQAAREAGVVERVDEEPVEAHAGDAAQVLANAPKSVDGFFVVPKVVE